MGMNETWIFLELIFPDAFWNRKMSLEEDSPEYVLPPKINTYSRDENLSYPICMAI